MTAIPARIPRYFALRGASLPSALLLRHQPNALAIPLLALRYASTKPPPKPLPQHLKKKQPAVLAKPDKYRPPSHGAALPRSQTEYRSYGPKLSEEDKERMRTKKYPNMMAPKGTFMNWFLNDRGIHVYITFGILFSLTVAAWYIEWTTQTPYKSMLPSKKDYLHHPWTSINQFFSIYKMHVAYKSQETAEMRAAATEDAFKRKEYRQERIREAAAKGEEWIEHDRFYLGEDGIRRRRVKKWFGIWE